MSGSRLERGTFFGRVGRQKRVGPFVFTHMVHTAAREIPAHTHEEAFVTLLVNGIYSESTGHRTIHFDQLSSVFHPPNYLHQDRIGTGGGEFFIVEFHPQGLIDAGMRSTPFRSIADLTGKPATWMLLSMFRGIANGEHDDITLESLSWELVGALASYPRPVRPGLRALRYAIEFLTENYSENLTLKEVASAAEVHPVYLGELFRTELHMTMGEFLNRVRVRRAAIALEQEPVSLTAVALNCGFYDQSHFTRVFKRVTGYTPGQFFVSARPHLRKRHLD